MRGQVAILGCWLLGLALCCCCAGQPAAGAALDDNSWEQWLDAKLLPPDEAKGMLRALVEKQIAPLSLPTTKEQWLARREALRREILAVVGIDDLVPARCDLSIKPHGTLRREGYRIEKLTFESYPGMAIPALLYVPEGITDRVPGMVSITGHTPASKAAEYVQQRNVNLALRGCVVLCYDYYGMGQRNTGPDPLHGKVYGGGNDHDIRTFSFSRGSATAIEALDAIRAVDVLAARAEVDPARIGFTGESGGSNTTYWVAALDPRVKLAVPVCSVTTFDYWIRTDVNWDWHQRPPGIRRIADIGTLLALHAPNPLLIQSSKRHTDDHEFPLEEAEKAHQWARHVYRLYGAEDAVSHVESITAHGYQEDKREQLYRAVERWLRPPHPKGDKELPAKVETYEALLCPLPAKNHTLRSVYAEWIQPLPRTIANDTPASQRAFLRERLGWPDTLPNVQAKRLRRDARGPWAAEFWLVETEPSVRVSVVCIGPRASARQVTLVPGRDRPAIARALRSGRTAVAFDPRGTGETAGREGVWRNWSWFAGRPVPGQQAMDLVQAARFCKDALGATSVVVDAENAHGWPALLAAAAAPEAIASGRVHIPRASLLEQVRTGDDRALADVPGLLERLDIPQLRALWPAGSVAVKP